MTKSQSNSAGAALKGYGYQRDVTVWAALRMILMDQLTDTITVEPFTKEDLQSSPIDRNSNCPKVGVQTDTFTISIQVKTKSKGNWGQANTKRLLEHGKKRPSAIEQLKDPSVRYLLITDAGIDGNVHELGMRGFESWPKKNANSNQ